MKLFSLLFLVFFLVFQASAQSCDEHRKACAETPGCMDKCADEITELDKECNLDNSKKLVKCGRELCKKDIGCLEKLSIIVY